MVTIIHLHHHRIILSVHYEYVYLTCVADAVAVSFVMLSAAGLDSDWLERVDDWMVYCCLVISVVLVTHGSAGQVTGDLKLC